MNIHLVHLDFYHLLLLDLFVITRLIADETIRLSPAEYSDGNIKNIRNIQNF